MECRYCHISCIFDYSTCDWICTQCGLIQEYDGIYTSTECRWKPSVSDHMYHMVDSVVRRTEIETNDLQEICIDTQLIMDELNINLHQAIVYVLCKRNLHLIEHICLQTKYSVNCVKSLLSTNAQIYSDALQDNIIRHMMEIGRENKVKIVSSLQMNHFIHHKVCMMKGYTNEQYLAIVFLIHFYPTYPWKEWTKTSQSSINKAMQLLDVIN